MTKILVLYYSAYGHIEQMAEAVAQGIRETVAEAVIKRAPELVSADIAKAAHFKLDQMAPIATINELADYDGIIVGAGTRFGRMSSQMASFLDQAGGLWARGAAATGSIWTGTPAPNAGPPRAPLIYREAAELIEKGFGLEIAPVILPERADFHHSAATGRTRPPILRYRGPVPNVRCFSKVLPDRPRNRPASAVRRNRVGICAPSNICTSIAMPAGSQRAI